MAPRHGLPWGGRGGCPIRASDRGNKVRLPQIVSGLARAGRAALMTTHPPAHALRHAARAVLTGNGRFIANGTPAEVMTGERLSKPCGASIHGGGLALPGHRAATCPPAFRCRRRGTPQRPIEPRGPALEHRGGRKTLADEPGRVAESSTRDRESAAATCSHHAADLFVLEKEQKRQLLRPGRAYRP